MAPISGIGPSQSLAVLGHREVKPMLSPMLTYHDGLYLAVELGTLGLVLMICWLAPRLDRHWPQH